MEPTCPFCECLDRWKNGVNGAGSPKFKCKNCKRQYVENAKSVGRPRAEKTSDGNRVNRVIPKIPQKTSERKTSERSKPAPVLEEKTSDSIQDASPERVPQVKMEVDSLPDPPQYIPPALLTYWPEWYTQYGNMVKPSDYRQRFGAWARVRHREESSSVTDIAPKIPVTSGPLNLLTPEQALLQSTESPQNYQSRPKLRAAQDLMELPTWIHGHSDVQVAAFLRWYETVPLSVLRLSEQEQQRDFHTYCAEIGG